MSLIKELSRRNVFRVMLTYAVAAWLLVEGMDLLTDVFEAPTWVMKVFVGVVVLGFIPVAVFSWIYEITPEGIKKESTDNPVHTAAASQKLNVTVVVMLAVAIGVLIFKGGNQDEAMPPVAESSGPPMLAVLPFVSASLTGDSKFFAVGVHDDLLTQLSKIDAFSVISRTSVPERGRAKAIKKRAIAVTRRPQGSRMNGRWRTSLLPPARCLYMWRLTHPTTHRGP